MSAEVISTLLVAMLAALVPLFLIPTKCEHECVACVRARVEREAARQRKDHDAWHRHPQPGCPYCERP